jgi:hypothetical protein
MVKPPQSVLRSFFEEDFIFWNGGAGVDSGWM